MAAQTVGNVVALMPIPVANVSGEAMQAVMSMRRDELAKLEADKVFQAFLSPTLDDKVLFKSSM